MANLISLQEYKELEGMGLSNTKDDAKLEALITSVSGLIKAYCNTSFVDYVTTPIEQMYHILKPTTRVFLREQPLISIVSVLERARGATEYTALSDYYYDEETGSVFTENTSWAIGPASLKISYRAGYAELPDDLKIAVANLVTYYHKEQYKASTASVAGSTLNMPTSNNQPAFPGHIKRVLDLYRSIL